MKKILFLLYTPRYSGAEVIISNLINNNKKVESYILVSNDFKGKIGEKTIHTNFIKKLNRDNSSILKTIIIFFYNLFGLTKVLLKLQKVNKFNIIHINNIILSIYSLPAIIYFKFMYPRLTLVWHTQNINYIEGKWIRVLEKLVIHIFDYTIVVSEAIKEKINIDSKKIKLLYSGIDTNLFKFNSSIRLTLKNKYYLDRKIIIGMFGTISLYKGQLQFLDVFKELVDIFPSIHILIIGEFASGEIKEKIYKDMEFLGKKNITVLKPVENIFEYYSMTDIIINNTSTILSEPLGTTILEGMATENIVLASKLGGTPEIIDDGFDGFMFEPDNMNDLRNKLLYILTNFNDLKFIRKNARNKIVSKFNINKMTSNFNLLLGIGNNENP